MTKIVPVTMILRGWLEKEYRNWQLSCDLSPQIHARPVLKLKAEKEEGHAQKRLRSLLIEAAWVWRARDAKTGETYNQLLSKTGVPQKEIAALAGKLLIILWRLSLEQKLYRMI